MEETVLLVIVLLLPLTASLVVTQVNPYHALVMRGILGTIAALIYALFGAADVALTEALVGTMLSITLYAIAVRSSLSMRLGVLEGSPVLDASTSAARQLLQQVRQGLQSQHMRLELAAYGSPDMLATALRDREVHTIALEPTGETAEYRLITRVPRLQAILAQQTILSEVIAI
jgi:putative multicomponent Na+:H+ antiporter subunit B